MSDPTPGPRGLADERTHLAWRRTALAVGGGSLVAARLLAAHVGASGWLVGAAGVAVSLWLAVVAGRGAEQRRVGVLVVGTSAGAVLLALVGLVVVLVDGPPV